MLYNTCRTFALCPCENGISVSGHDRIRRHVTFTVDKTPCTLPTSRNGGSKQSSPRPCGLPHRNLARNTTPRSQCRTRLTSQCGLAHRRRTLANRRFADQTPAVFSPRIKQSINYVQGLWPVLSGWRSPSCLPS